MKSKIKIRVGEKSREVTLHLVLQRIFNQAANISYDPHLRGNIRGVKLALEQAGKKWITEGSLNQWHEINQRCKTRKPYKSPPADWIETIEEVTTILLSYFNEHILQLKGGHSTPEWNTAWKSQVLPKIQALAKKYKCK